MHRHTITRIHTSLFESKRHILTEVRPLFPLLCIVYISFYRTTQTNRNDDRMHSQFVIITIIIELQWLFFY